MGTLYLVATPIGNLGDITERAREVLSRVDYVACEDTRRARKLLSHLRIGRPLLSVPSHDEPRRARSLITHLIEGKNVAFVSDAGTPAVSDPGATLVSAAAAAGACIVPVPGPSAVTTAIAVSGLPTGRFAFLGFLPRKKTERRELLETFGSMPAALVVNEAPGRVGRTLAELARVLGPQRRAVVCRELTKMHEEIVRGALEELAERFAGVVRGEVTLVIAPPSEPGRPRAMLSLEQALPAIEAKMKAGRRLKDACKEVAKESELDARSLYKAALEFF